MEITKKNNIHQNQVFGLANKGVDYFFYFITPMINVTRAGISFDLHKTYTNSLNKSESIIPIPSIFGLMYLIIIPYYLLLTVPLLYCKAREIKPEIIHCRALLSAFLAVVVKKLFRMKYKIVCDPRSVYVEECVIHKAFRLDGINYKGWKKIESWIYRNSDACLGLSEFFADYMRKDNPNSYYVPALVQDNLVYDETLRKEQRKIHGLSNKDIVFVYIGSIGTWHSIELYMECLRKCKEQIPEGYNIRIVLLTGNNRAINELKQSFPVDSIIKIGQVPPQEIKNYLHIADFGIVPGSDNPGKHYDLLYSTMIASKAEEFLASGLPIIVNSRISSLAKMVKDNESGFIFSQDSFDADFKKSYDHSSISKVFNNEFKASSVVNKYKEIYQNIL